MTRIALNDEARDFVTVRHLAVLSTIGPDGAVHAVPIGYTVEEREDGLVLRVISAGGTQKVRNIERTGHATITQFEGPRWLGFSGPTTVTDEPDAVREAVERYSARYRAPRENPTRVALVMRPDRMLGSSSLRS